MAILTRKQVKFYWIAATKQHPNRLRFKTSIGDYTVDVYENVQVLRFNGAYLGKSGESLWLNDMVVDHYNATRDDDSPHQRAAKLKKAQLVNMFVKERGSVYGTGPRHRAEVRRFFTAKPKVALVMLAVSEGLVK